MSGVPIIKLEVDGMRHSIQVALMRHAAQIDKDMQRAVDAFCSEGNVARIVEEEARRHIQLALKEEVANFFKWDGAGRAAIRQAVQESLLKQFPKED